MPDTDRKDLDMISAVAREAGEVALEYFHGDPRRWNKHDDSVVTEADIALDTLLHERLTAYRPDYGWLSEERPDDGSRHETARVFVVDPIDGTRAFVERTDEWVVSVGIVEDGRPVAGVLFNPVRDELWGAHAGGGATCNGTELAVSGCASIESARIAASKKAIRQASLENVHISADHRFLKSLAHRLARVASGDVDAALATSGSADWDLAAALLIVQEAGGIVTDLDGGPIHLNGATARHPAFVAAGPDLHDAILAAIGQNQTEFGAQE
jgi:myo-inositol-1(or 4)-monophosphatase